MPGVGCNSTKKIECDGEVLIGRIEVHNVVGTARGDKIEQLRSEITMGINHSNAFTGLNVLNDQVPEEGRLAGTGLADEIEMMTPVGA